MVSSESRNFETTNTCFDTDLNADSTSNGKAGKSD